MANGGESWEMEDGDETLRGVASEVVMCSTCSGFVMRKKRTAIPHPDEEVVEVVKEAKKMRDLMHAVQRYGPFQEKEPAEATKEQWLVLRRRRMIMMETKSCPACSRSLLEMCPTCSRWLSEKPAGPDEVDKAAESKEEKKSSREVGSELMAATEDEAIVVDAGSVKKSNRLREKGNGSGSGLKKRKSKRSMDKGNGSGSGLKKKKKVDEDITPLDAQDDPPLDIQGPITRARALKIILQMEGSTSNKKSLDILKALPPVKPLTYATNHSLMAATEDEAMVGDDGLVKKLKGLWGGNGSSSGSEKKAKIENKEMEGSASNKVKMVGSEPAGGNVKTTVGGNGKTKMVTMRLDKKSLDILKALPPVKPLTYDTNHSLIQIKFASSIAKYEVDCEFHEYLLCESITRGYAEYQLEVSDDEENGHKLV